ALAAALLGAAARCRAGGRPAGAAGGRAVASGEGTPSGKPSDPGGFPLGLRLIAAWLGATVLVLAVEHPLWRSHASHLVPAAALLVAAAADRLLAGAPARRRPPALLTVVVAAGLVVPYHVIHLSEVLWPAPPG